MQGNYGYDISSGEEEGVPTNQTPPPTHLTPLTAHHSNQINHSSNNPPNL